MPWKNERNRERLQEHLARNRDADDLVENTFPLRDLAETGQGTNPREPVETIDLTYRSPLLFTPLGSLKVH